MLSVSAAPQAKEEDGVTHVGSTDHSSRLRELHDLTMPGERFIVARGRCPSHQLECPHEFIRRSRGVRECVLRFCDKQVPSDTYQGQARGFKKA